MVASSIIPGVKSSFGNQINRTTDLQNESLIFQNEKISEMLIRIRHY